MPRIHIHAQDIEVIEELEEQYDWHERLGLPAPDTRDTRDGARGERRFGGNESVARKRAERRKQVRRYAKRV